MSSLRLTVGFSIGGFSVRTTHVPNTRLPYSQTFYVSSETHEDVEYIVRTRLSNPGCNTNEYICSCPDFVFRAWADHKDCKHVEAVKTLVDIVGTPLLLASKLRYLSE